MAGWPPGKHCTTPAAPPAFLTRQGSHGDGTASDRPSVGITTASPHALREPKQVFHKAALKLDSCGQITLKFLDERGCITAKSSPKRALYDVKMIAELTKLIKCSAFIIQYNL